MRTSNVADLLQDKVRQAAKDNVFSVGPEVIISDAVAKPEDSVDHLRGLMTELYITHVPVMNHGKLAGILSFHDIARSVIKDVDFEYKLLKQYIKHWPE